MLTDSYVMLKKIGGWHKGPQALEAPLHYRVCRDGCFATGCKCSCLCHCHIRVLEA